MNNISWDNLYHAYAIEGPRSAILESLEDKLREELGVDLQAPHWRQEVDQFSIQEARNIHRHHQRRLPTSPFIYLLAWEEVTKQAQNALLKVIEEPQVGAHFFLVVPRLSDLLPTIISRVQTVSWRRVSSTGNTGSKLANSFLDGSYQDRLKIINQIIGNEADSSIGQFLDQLQILSREEIVSSETSQKTLSQAQQWVGQAGVTPKYILETLALSLPQKEAK